MTRGLDAAERLNKQLAREGKIVARKIYDLRGMNLSVWAAHDVARAFDALGLEYPGRKDLRLWAKDGFKKTPSEKRQTRADGRRADRETLKSNDRLSNFQSVEIFRFNVQEMPS
jgi:hypothetical protein